MRFKAIVQNVVDASYDSKKSQSHVDQRHIHVIEIGPEAHAGSMVFTAKGADVKVKPGDPCEVVCTGSKVWNGAVQFTGTVLPVSGK